MKIRHILAAIAFAAVAIQAQPITAPPATTAYTRTLLRATNASQFVTLASMTNVESAGYLVGFGDESLRELYGSPWGGRFYWENGTGFHLDQALYATAFHGNGAGLTNVTALNTAGGTLKVGPTYETTLTSDATGLVINNPAYAITLGTGGPVLSTTNTTNVVISGQLYGGTVNNALSWLVRSNNSLLFTNPPSSAFSNNVILGYQNANDATNHQYGNLVQGFRNLYAAKRLPLNSLVQGEYNAQNALTPGNFLCIQGSQNAFSSQTVGSHNMLIGQENAYTATGIGAYNFIQGFWNLNKAKVVGTANLVAGRQGAVNATNVGHASMLVGSDVATNVTSTVTASTFIGTQLQNPFGTNALGVLNLGGLIFGTGAWTNIAVPLFDAAAGGKISIGTTNQPSTFTVGGDATVTSNLTAGNFCIILTNASGSNSVLGMVVEMSGTTDFAYKAAPVDSVMPVGIVAEDGITNGAPVRIITSGIAQVLCDDQTTTNWSGSWLGVSANTPGRAKVLSVPSNSTDHDRELGHGAKSRAFAASNSTTNLIWGVFHIGR